MIRVPLVLLAALLLFFRPALAAESGVELVHAPIDPYDFGSLQRGAKMYVNYCQGCHSLQYLRYTRIVDDLGIPEDLARSSLALEDGLFQPLGRTMSDGQARAWFNEALPPDLSLIARSRGADWLFTFLRSFYRDPERPSGWNNLVFAGTSMPHVLQGLQGTYRLDDGGALVRAGAGRLDDTAYGLAVADLVNFLVYAGEPVRNLRVTIGYGVMIFLLFLLPIVYLTYREYWRKV